MYLNPTLLGIGTENINIQIHQVKICTQDNLIKNKVEINMSYLLRLR